MKFFLLALIAAVVAAQLALSGAAAPKKSPAKSSSKTARRTPSKTASKSTAKKRSSTTVSKSTAKKKTASSSRGSSSRKRSASRRRAVRQPAGQQQPTPERYAEIQQALIERGYLDTPATGRWGPESIAALKRFEADQSFEPDGKLDSWALIALGLGPKRASASGTKAAP